MMTFFDFKKILNKKRNSNYNKCSNTNMLQDNKIISNKTNENIDKNVYKNKNADKNINKNIYENVDKIKSKNVFLKIAIIFILLIIFTYVCNISLMPETIVMMQGDTLNINTILGINLRKQNGKGEIVEASSNINKNKVSNVGKLDLKVSLFGNVPVKDVTVNVIPKVKVIPVGKAIGMKLYTDGVLVVGMSEIEGKKPYENCGIKEGDRIVEIDNSKINSTNELIDTVNNSNGNPVGIKYISENEEILTTSIKPVKTGEEYKLGLWVRDAAAGVGTLTFYNPEDNKCVALGHGITDIDTSKLINIASGELVSANILSIQKGEKGKPGEMKGTIENGYTLGKVYKNTAFGVYGDLKNKNILKIQSNEEVEVASREEIKIGKAKILCELENGKQKEYEIEIQRIFTNNNSDNKSMLIKVTDNELLEKTGGIVQGMSGAPILQNGKLIGAVTHVLVNDPTEGYAVFGHILVKQMSIVE